MNNSSNKSTTNNLESFFRNKKIFLTGHTGFKGSWLSLWLTMMGAKVCGYSLEPEPESLYNIIKIKNGLEKSTFSDIRNIDALELAVKKFQPEIIIHMAAQPLVRASYFSPRETYETNVIGTLNVFEAARKSSSVKTILNITTDKCYENKETINPYQENDPLGGYDPYSSSKACAEILTSSYRNSFLRKENINTASARAGNVIGGGDFSSDRIIPDIFRSIRKNNQVIIRSPFSIRPWQHVLEPLYGYLLLTKKLFEDGNKFAKAYNFGPNIDEEINVQKLTEYFIKEFGQGSYKIEENQNLHEAKTLKLDNSLAKKELKWQPSLKFEDSIRLTSEWYKNYSNDSADSISLLTRKQIESYQKLVESLLNN